MIAREHPMCYEHLSYKKEDHVVIIDIIEHPGHQLEIPQLASELSYLCPELAMDDKVRVVTISLKQRGLSSEENIGGGKLKCDEAGIGQWSLSKAVAALEMPVVIAIDGYAIGPALELALACDIRITSEKSYFGMPQLSSGILPFDGGTQRMSRLVGKSKAIELILTGEVIDASEAYRIGLVNKVCRHKDPLSETLDIARKIAEKSPIATKYAKEAVCKGMDLTLEQGMRLEADLYYLIHTTMDRHEGITAFQEKRQAVFKGD